MFREEVTSTGELRAFSGGREVARLNANGSHWIAPDITDKEIREAFPALVRAAANLNRLVLECGEKHKS